MHRHNQEIRIIIWAVRLLPSPALLGYKEIEPMQTRQNSGYKKVMATPVCRSRVRVFDVSLVRVDSVVTVTLLPYFMVTTATGCH